MHFPHFPFADLDRNFIFAPFLIPFFFIAGGVTVAITAIYFHFQRQKLWHDTVRLSLEKGVPLPAQMTPDPRVVGDSCDNRWGRRRPFRDLRTGLILVAAGLALSFQMHGNHELDWHPGGAILLFIGIAFLICALLGRIFARRD